LNSGRGSRPGFSSSARMSSTVGRPNRSSEFAAGSVSATSPVAHDFGWIAAAGGDDLALDQHRLGVDGTRHRAVPCRRGCAGSRPPVQRPSAQPRDLRAARAGGEGAVLVAMATIASASPGPTPETRESSGAEAVLRSTPTAFTHPRPPHPGRASRCWSTSCWYWPTPMLFGSILTSSASGSCRRRAMETAPRRETSSPEIPSRQFAGGIDRGPGFADHHLDRLFRSGMAPADRPPAFPSPGWRCRCRWRSA
jgi:hypothetical protein